VEDLQCSEAQQDYLARVASIYIQDYKTKFKDSSRHIKIRAFRVLSCLCAFCYIALIHDKD